jgi:hypothetical protein
VALTGARYAQHDEAGGSCGLQILRADGPPPPAETPIFHWPGRYGLTLARSNGAWRMSSKLDGVFLIDQAARTLTAFDLSAPPTPGSIDILVRRVLPRVASLFGALALHGAALARDNGSVLVLGPSGAGKSTLTAMASMTGWDALSDDISILWDQLEPIVTAGATGACLWPDSQEGLQLDRAAGDVLPGYDGKLRFGTSTAEVPLSVPLRAFVCLERGDRTSEIDVEPMQRGEAFVAITRQLVRFNPTDIASHQGAMTRINTLLTQVPCFRLRYPTRYDVLPQVTDRLRALARE